MTPREFFDSIDYQQLVFQKEELLDHLEYLKATLHNQDITLKAVDGVINLLDSIQDCAANVYGEEKVFMFSKKADYLLKYRHYCNDNGVFDDTEFISTKDLFDFVEKIIIPNEDE
jgi:hypothetical protein